MGLLLALDGCIHARGMRVLVLMEPRVAGVQSTNSQSANIGQRAWPLLFYPLIYEYMYILLVGVKVRCNGY